VNTLTSEQWEALRDLRTICPDTSVALIGGSALAWHNRLGGRETEDLDLTVAISLDSLRRRLQAAPGWTPDPRQAQRWRYKNAALVDLLPSTNQLIAAGEVVWPDSGTTMSLVGFDHVHTYGLPITADDPLLKVASLPTLALLKVVSYLDRPTARAKDLQDLTLLMDRYLDDDDDRLYIGAASDEELWNEEANTYLLGLDIGRMLTDEEHALLQQFIAKARDRDDVHHTQAVLTRRAPLSWERNIETTLRRLTLLERGLLKGRAAD